MVWAVGRVLVVGFLVGPLFGLLEDGLCCLVFVFGLLAFNKIQMKKKKRKCSKLFYISKAFKQWDPRSSNVEPVCPFQYLLRVEVNHDYPNKYTHQ